MNFGVWGLIAGLAALAFYLGWRWRQTEKERQKLVQAGRAIHEDLHVLENEFARQARFLQAVEKVSEEGIFLIEEGDLVVWMNDVARRLSNPDSQLPNSLSQIVQHYETLTLVRDAFLDDDPYERQFASGDRNYLAVAQRIIQDPALVTLTVADVTELLRLGRSRRDFLANISHDLRTPIAAIQLMVETLRTGKVDDARREKLLNSIYEQTASLQQLSQEMLDLSMIELGRMPLKLEETAVSELIESVCLRMRAQAEHKNIALTSDVSPGLCVWADVNHVQRVLQNLLHNAIKFTPEGGCIEVRGHAEGDEVVIAVADTGVGIAAEDIEQIFERFYKANRVRSDEGTGLGLAIARHIVLGHGGRIWVESEAGQGATFLFTLPRV